MKHIIIIPDGAADYPVEELGGKTLLQAAKKPNIDLLAKEGRCGLFKTIPDHFSNGSAVANLSILGYDPRRFFHGRGVLEAVSMGVTLEPDDVAFRCNTISVSDGAIRNHSAGHISNGEGARIISTLREKLGSDTVRFYPGVGYRHLLVLKGGYSPDVDCKPPHDYLGGDVEALLPKAKSPAAVKTEELVRRLIRESATVLNDHPVNRERIAAGKSPANLIWFWSPGRKPTMETFQKRFGIRGAVISAVDLVRGLGIYAGFDVIPVEGATGLFDTNYEGKADAAVAALENHDLVYVHVEAPDEAGHDGDLSLKLRCIEDVDRRLVGRILEKTAGNNTGIAVLPDHPTPVKVRGHTSEPVPFLIRTPGIAPDAVTTFDEVACAQGSYGLLEGDAFIRAVLSLSLHNRQPLG